MSNEESNWTVITGSTGGLGAAIADILSFRGDNLILVNRSEQKAEDQKQRLLGVGSSSAIELVTADFMDMEAVDLAIRKITEISGRVGTLYNNAGLLTSGFLTSVQGYEGHFAVNTLTPYQLTIGLKDKMTRKDSEEPSMVINMSSSVVHRQKTLDIDNLAKPASVSGLMGTYAQSKLAVTALSVAIAEQLQERGIAIRAVDPGATRTPMTAGNSAMPAPLRWIAPLLFGSAEKNAAKVVWSSNPARFAGGTGLLVANQKISKPPVAAADTETQGALLSLLNETVSVAR